MKVKISFILVSYFIIFFSGESAFSSPLDDFNLNYSNIVKQFWHSPVKIHGIKITVFDFETTSNELKQKWSKFKKAIDALKKIEPKTLEGDQEEAFWINVYNFGAMKLVAPNYPVDLIRSMKIDRQNKRIKLAWILKKDGHLFKNGNESEVLDFVVNYLSNNDMNWLRKHRRELKISYFKHD